MYQGNCERCLRWLQSSLKILYDVATSDKDRMPEVIFRKPLRCRRTPFARI